MNKEIIRISELLKKELDVPRYEHTIGVMHTAACLAMRYDTSLMDKALLAGLLHDCAKCTSHVDKIRICAENHIDVTKTELKNPGLLHAKVGAFFAKEKYNIDDPEILDAIVCHTTGKPAMTLLDKILYIADYMEPGRDKASNLLVVRDLAFKDLNQCLYVILKDSVEYLKTRNIPIDPMTEDTFMYYNSSNNNGEI